jgi:hypothetical protein
MCTRCALDVHWVCTGCALAVHCMCSAYALHTPRDQLQARAPLIATQEYMSPAPSFRRSP